MDRVFGCDVSTWQDQNSTPRKIDFVKMKSEGAGFVFCRASFGPYPDSDFSDYWTAAKAAGIPRGAYTFPLVTQPIAGQIQKFIDQIKSDRGELPPVLDIEPYEGSVPGKDAIKTAIRMIEDQLKVKPILYTNYYVWRDQVKGDDIFFKDYPLWLASYNLEPYIKIPRPWTGWTFWQYTSKGDGPRFGAESLNIDMNFFMGDQRAFDLFIGKVPVEEPVGVPDPERLNRLWAAHPELH